MLCLKPLGGYGLVGVNEVVFHQFDDAFFFGGLEVFPDPEFAVILAQRNLRVFLDKPLCAVGVVGDAGDEGVV